MCVRRYLCIYKYIYLKLHIYKYTLNINIYIYIYFYWYQIGYFHVWFRCQGWKIKKVKCTELPIPWFIISPRRLPSLSSVFSYRGRRSKPSSPLQDCPLLAPSSQAETEIAKYPLPNKTSLSLHRFLK